MTDQDFQEKMEKAGVQVKDWYEPSDAAKILDISVTLLRYWRLNGRIHGTKLGNTTVYTAEQIMNADQKNRKPGPKKEQ